MAPRQFEIPDSTTALLTIALCTWIAGCAHIRDQSSTQSVVHVVVCWLKHPGNADERQRLINASVGFEKVIPGLKRVYAGRVLPSTRPAVDSSFDVAIVMVFESEAALIHYGQTPQHQQAVRDVLVPLVDHYTVYDFQK